MLQDIWNDALVPAIILIVTTTVTVLAGYAAAAIKKWGEKQTSELVQAALRDLSTAAYNAVQTVNQTFVDNAKAASEDGKLTTDEMRHAFASAMEVAGRQLSKDTLAVLVKALGSMGAVEAALGDMIEDSVWALRDV